ncbi:MAG: hypothetical protein IJO10_10010 [Clostridia bacterium]|nr:hypothetical protein [Clostridia bacterium]
MRFYISGGSENSAYIASLSTALAKNGHIINTPACTSRASYDDLFEIAYKKVFSVTDADFVLLLLPGTDETLAELGLALASRNNKRIVVWSQTGNEFLPGDEACAFYHHTAVERLQGDFEELTKKLLNL